MWKDVEMFYQNFKLHINEIKQKLKSTKEITIKGKIFQSLLAGIQNKVNSTLKIIVVLIFSKQLIMSASKSTSKYRT